MQELKPIPGFPGYFASTDGTIWTQRRKGGNDRGAGRLLEQPRPLKMSRNPSGYMTVSLDLEGKAYPKRVHRLILETFVGPAPEGYHGCHFPDPDKTNNRLENLRWDTISENAKDRYRVRMRKESKPCTRCHEVKPFKEFYKDKRNTDGLQSECKTCHTQLTLATRDENKKRVANRLYMQRRRVKDAKIWR